MIAKPRNAADSGTGLDAVELVCNQLRDYLDGKRLQIAREISSYPPPIPACDAQFNHLLEERARLSDELGRLDALRADSSAHENYVELIDAFAASSPNIDAETKLKIRVSLRKNFWS